MQQTQQAHTSAASTAITTIATGTTGATLTAGDTGATSATSATSTASATSDNYVSASELIVNKALNAVNADKLKQKDSTTTYVSAKDLNIGGDAETMGGRNRNGYVQRNAYNVTPYSNDNYKEWWGNNGVGASLGLKLQQKQPLQYWNAAGDNTTKGTYTYAGSGLELNNLWTPDQATSTVGSRF